jgi:hypothetical protein
MTFKPPSTGTAQPAPSHCPQIQSTTSTPSTKPINPTYDSTYEEVLEQQQFLIITYRSRIPSIDPMTEPAIAPLRGIVSRRSLGRSPVVATEDVALSYEEGPLELDPENVGTDPPGQNSALYPPQPDPPTTPGSGSLLSPSADRP